MGAEMHFNKGAYGDALRKCYEIENVFADITEDQFDFHQYCMRKMTLSKYVDMLRLEDQLREHRFFRCAAVIAIEIYIQIFDGVWNPDTGKSGSEEAKLSESELKKLKKKQKSGLNGLKNSVLNGLKAKPCATKLLSVGESGSNKSAPSSVVSHITAPPTH